MTSSSDTTHGTPVRRSQRDARPLLQQATHLRRGEVLAVLADPVIGASVEVEEATPLAHDHVTEITGVVDTVADFEAFASAFP